MQAVSIQVRSNLVSNLLHKDTMADWDETGFEPPPFGHWTAFLALLVFFFVCFGVFFSNISLCTCYFNASAGLDVSTPVHK